jgi:hypothetical protein
MLRPRFVIERQMHVEGEVQGRAESRDQVVHQNLSLSCFSRFPFFAISRVAFTDGFSDDFMPPSSLWNNSLRN